MLLVAIIVFSVISGGCGVVDLNRQLAHQERGHQILGDKPLAYFANEPISADGDSVSVEVTGLNVASYRYAVVVTRILQSRQLVSQILSQPKFVARLLQKSNKLLFDRIVADPEARQQLRRVAFEIIGNQNLVSAITNADGVDAAEVTGKMTEIIGDITKLDQEQDQNKRKALQDKISKDLQGLQRNKALVAATLSAMSLQGDFLSQLLRRENIIEDLLGDQQFIAEVLQLEEGQLFNKIVDIPLAVEKLSDITFMILGDDQLLAKLLLPSAEQDARLLLSSFLELLEELEENDKTGVSDVDHVKQRISEVFQELTENQRLIARVFSDLVLEVAFLAYYPDFCNEENGEVEYSDNQPLDQPISIDGLREALGEDGLQAICVIGEDDEGNEQEEPTVELLEGEMRVTLSGDNLPAAGELSKRRSIEVTVQGHSPLLVGYRFLLLNGEQCPFDLSRYSQNVYSFDQTIQGTVLTTGPKSLCVFGVNSEQELATNIIVHSWRYQIPRGPARFDVRGTIQHLYAGEQSASDIIIRNIGDGVLNWQLTVNNSIDWLDIRMGDNGNWLNLANIADSGVQTTVVEGATDSGQISKLQLRVSALPSETGGVEQEVLTLRRENGIIPIKINVTLHAPQMRLTTEEVFLTSENPRAFIGVRNDRPEASISWKVRHVFPVEVVGTHISSTRHRGIDRYGWNVGVGGVYVDVRRPMPKKSWIQVFIFESRGGEPIPVAIHFQP